MLEYTDFTGKDFEFTIVHPDDFSIDGDTFDKLMTPDDMEWLKVQKDGWESYRVGHDEFSYSWEPPGLQMTFSENFPFVKAKQIVEQVVEKLKKNYRQEFTFEFIPYRAPTKAV